jgi:hypothetical protein
VVGHRERPTHRATQLPQIPLPDEFLNDLGVVGGSTSTSGYGGLGASGWWYRSVCVEPAEAQSGTDEYLPGSADP